MDTIIAIAILFAIGFAVSKSKILSGLLDGFGIAMNWLWGSLCVVGGLWGMFNGLGLWSVLIIGVGIYFFTTSRFDKKVEDAAQSVVDSLSDKVAERLSGGTPATPDGAGSAQDAAGPGQVSKRPSTKIVLYVIGIVGVLYGIWGLQNAGEVTTTYTFEGTTPSDYGMKSTTDVDTGGALPWLALLGGGAAIAVGQALDRREKSARAAESDQPEASSMPSAPTTAAMATGEPAESLVADDEVVEAAGATEPEEVEPEPAEEPAQPEPVQDDSYQSLVPEPQTAAPPAESRRVNPKLVIAAVVICSVLVVAYVANRAQERDEAEREYAQSAASEPLGDGVYDSEPEPVVESEPETGLTEDEAVSGELPPPPSDWHVMNLEELLSRAPEDGSGVTDSVYYYSEKSRADSVLYFSINEGDYPPEFSIDLSTPSYYSIDGADVSADEFLAAITQDDGMDGSIQYNKGELVSVDAVSSN